MQDEYRDDDVVQNDLMKGYEWPAPTGKASDAWLKSRMKKNDGKLPFTEYVAYIMEDLGYIQGNSPEGHISTKWRLMADGAKKMIELERKAIEAGKGYTQKTHPHLGYRGPDDPDELVRPDDYGISGEEEVENRKAHYKSMSTKFDPSRWQKFKDDQEQGEREEV